MQRLIGFASPPRQKQSDIAGESLGDKLERRPKQWHSAPTIRRDQ
jgi:hypothetical protein